MEILALSASEGSPSGVQDQGPSASMGTLDDIDGFGVLSFLSGDFNT